VHRPTGIVDSQAALQANKATFFFQLVCQDVTQAPDDPSSVMLTREQERELEKVNAFYLQKEAEVGGSLYYGVEGWRWQQLTEG
jgi:CDK inhibitor PHO81